MKKSKYSALDWVKVLIFPILLIVGVIVWLLNKKEKRDPSNKAKFKNEQEYIDYTHSIADALGTGFNYRPYESDIDAIILVAKLNVNDYKIIKGLYEILVKATTGNSLSRDLTELTSFEDRAAYQKDLNPLGIY